MILCVIHILNIEFISQELLIIRGMCKSNFEMVNHLMLMKIHKEETDQISLAEVENEFVHFYEIKRHH